MKYNFFRKGKGNFEPFSVTLTFETDEEATFFHDKIAIKYFSVNTGRFIGDLYSMSEGYIEFAEGITKLETKT